MQPISISHESLSEFLYQTLFLGLNLLHYILEAFDVGKGKDFQFVNDFSLCYFLVFMNFFVSFLLNLKFQMKKSLEILVTANITKILPTRQYTKLVKSALCAHINHINIT